ncbi:MAG: hypothetical protein KC496_03650 [Anaerolineae bacterium]|nr:hypothetical protein [Anaerolineae bacterium]
MEQSAIMAAFDIRLSRLERWLDALAHNPDNEQLALLQIEIKSLRDDMIRAGVTQKLPEWTTSYLH